MASVAFGGTDSSCAISSDSRSISSSRRWLKIEAACSAPSDTSRAAALLTPLSWAAPAVAGVGSGTVAISVPGPAARASSSFTPWVSASTRSGSAVQPGPHLLSDALRVLLDDLLDLLAHRVGRRLDERGPALTLEVGQRGRRLDLAQPDGLEVLALVAAQVAGHEEEEQQHRQPQEDPLGQAHRAGGGAGLGRSLGLGEGDLRHGDRVAAGLVDARGRGQGVLQGLDVSRWHGLVDDHRDVLAVDLARRDLGALDSLPDRLLGVLDGVVVVGVPARAAAAVGVLRDVAGGARRAAGRPAAAG